MRPQDKQADIADPQPKTPYQRPELKRVGTLRDVTAQKTGNDLAPA
jgi:hypothetical protein